MEDCRNISKNSSVFAKTSTKGQRLEYIRDELIEITRLMELEDAPVLNYLLRMAVEQADFEAAAKGSSRSR